MVKDWNKFKNLMTIFTGSANLIVFLVIIGSFIPGVDLIFSNNIIVRLVVIVLLFLGVVSTGSFLLLKIFDKRKR